MSYSDEKEVVKMLRNIDYLYARRALLKYETGCQLNKAICDKLDKYMSLSDKQLEGFIKSCRDKAKKERQKEYPYLFCKY